MQPRPRPSRRFRTRSYYTLNGEVGHADKAVEILNCGSRDHYLILQNIEKPSGSFSIHGSGRNNSDANSAPTGQLDLTFVGVQEVAFDPIEVPDVAR